VGGGGAFSMGMAVGGPNHTTTHVVLYIIYFTPFSASVVQRKENLFCSLHKMMETGELFVVYSALLSVSCELVRNLELAPSRV
jgi:hypothetical protein